MTLKKTIDSRRGSDLEKELDENSRLYQKSLRENSDINQTSYPLVELAPFYLADISTLSRQRKANYRQHINKLVDSVFDEPQGDIGRVLEQDKKQPASADVSCDKNNKDQLNKLICQACKGRCCLNAGNESYLQLETIRCYARLYPALSAEQIKQEYEQRIPEKTYHLSCINHTEIGCALPREMRSEMCNEFYCSTIKEFNMLFLQAETRPAGAIVIARALTFGQSKQVRVVKVDC